MINNGPTLISPNGGEMFTSNQVTITWYEPTDITDSTDLIFYEILYTSFYKRFGENDWVQVAFVPKGTTSYIWHVSSHIKTINARIGIRAVDHKGERSELSFSADPFAIRDKHLPVPAVVEPVGGRNYFSNVPIIIDYEGVVGQASERAFYQIFYRSKSLGVDWTLIEASVYVGADPIFWDVKKVNKADDYELRIELIDQDFKSNPLFIEGLKINNFNFF